MMILTGHCHPSLHYSPFCLYFFYRRSLWMVKMASFYSGVFLATSGSSLKDDLELFVYFMCLFSFRVFYFDSQEDTAAACVFTIFDV
jgi:hypothetical protein